MFLEGNYKNCQRLHCVVVGVLRAISTYSAIMGNAFLQMYLQKDRRSRFSRKPLLARVVAHRFRSVQSTLKSKRIGSYSDRRVRRSGNRLPTAVPHDHSRSDHPGRIHRFSTFLTRTRVASDEWRRAHAHTRVLYQQKRREAFEQRRSTPKPPETAHRLLSATEPCPRPDIASACAARASDRPLRQRRAGGRSVGGGRRVLWRTAAARTRARNGTNEGDNEMQAYHQFPLCAGRSNCPFLLVWKLRVSINVSARPPPRVTSFFLLFCFISIFFPRRLFLFFFPRPPLLLTLLLPPPSFSPAFVISRLQCGLSWLHTNYRCRRSRRSRALTRWLRSLCFSCAKTTAAALRIHMNVYSPRPPVLATYASHPLRYSALASRHGSVRVRNTAI